ncbi:MAG TPA: RHS repeat-associated core domain-containing protein, partial [Agriterribacter sp.]|nr:RHS repeat-associated core domain-containing protein [Agriterribacter sp.]
QTYNSSKPKAYINWILLDEQFKYYDGGFEQVGNDEEFKVHVKSGSVTKNGYLYVYVSNETPDIAVFFDNLQITHTRGPILEETHYYPFGLIMAGISSKALNNTPVNRYKFNDGTELENKEFTDGSGLEWYATDFRSYDPQIGRFHQIDPLSEIADDWSPYVFAYNNPILFNDPLGLSADSTTRPLSTTAANAIVLDEVVIVGRGNGSSSGENASTSSGTTSTSGTSDFEGKGNPFPNYSASSSETYKKLVGYDPTDLISLLQHTVLEKPTWWEQFWYGPFYEGRNTFGDKVQSSYYGGIAPAPSLGKVDTYMKLAKLTKNLKGTIQAHHLVEVRHLKRLFLSTKNAPSVLLSKADHQQMTKILQQLLPYGRTYTKQQIIDAYKQAYLNFPQWIDEAVKYLQ